MGKRKTNKQFIEEVNRLVGNEYIFLEEYQGATKKIKIRHNEKKCSFYEYEVSPNDFLNGKRCAKCRGVYKRTHEDFVSELKTVQNGEFIALEKFTGVDKNMLLKHLLCGYEWKVRPLNILREKQYCPKCSNNNSRELYKLSFQDVFHFIKQSGYRLMSTSYTNAHEKIQITCPEGHQFEMTYNNFQQGQRCHVCNYGKTSRAEVFISNYLEINNIPYEKQYTFKDCKNKQSLPFDFAIFNTDGSIKYLIEYDGEQHFKPVKFFGGEVGYFKTKENDRIKTMYCLSKNIKLRRISYHYKNNRLKEELDHILK